MKNKKISVLEIIEAVLTSIIGLIFFIFLAWFFLKIYFQVWAIFGIKSKSLVLILTTIIASIFNFIILPI